MGLFELIVIALGLSMDAFAVSVCKGLSMQKKNYGRALLIALFFGVFQALMPLIGWAVGSHFEQHIARFDHWIAFALLAFIGGKMIYDSIGKDGDYEDCYCLESFSIKELFILSIATSIDALTVGIAFAVIGIKGSEILFSITLIGLVTFTLSFIGVIAGNVLGIKFKKKAEVFGGVILILIGFKILLEHLGVIDF